MQRWINWLYIKNLVSDLDDGGLQDPGFRKMRHMLKPIHKAVMADGNPINLDDPAVALFFKMIEVTPTSDTTLADAVRSLEVWHLINLKKPGIGSYDSPELEELVNLRLVPNGWAELDRVVQQISEQTLSSRVSWYESNVLLNQDDPGLNGPTVYSLNLSMKWDGAERQENLALASSPAEIVKLVGKVLEKQGEKYLQYGYDSMSPAPVDIYLMRGEDLVWMAPVNPTIVSKPVGENFHNYDDHANPFVDWSKVNWRRHDREVFRALVDYLPKPLANKVKGTFLSDELGM